MASKLLLLLTNVESWWRMLVLTLRVSSMTRLFQLSSKNWWFALAQEEISLTYHHLTWPTKHNHLAQFHNGLTSYQFRQDILDEIEKVKFHSEWGKCVFTTWFETVVTGHLSSTCLGSASSSSMQKTDTPIMTAETIEHVAQLFWRAWFIIWWERDAKDLLPEDLPIQVHQMENSKRNRHYGRMVWLRFIMERSC